jgi:hypothetical protein
MAEKTLYTATASMRPSILKGLTGRHAILPPFPKFGKN